MAFYTGTDSFLGDCTGIFYRIPNLPCLIRELLGVLGYTFFSVAVVLIPTSFALRAEAKHGISVALGVAASAVLWRDLVFLPFHPYGGPWLDASRSSQCVECSSAASVGQLLSYLTAGGETGNSVCAACDLLPLVVSIVTYLLAIGMMVLIPVSLILLGACRAQRLGVAVVSLATLSGICLIGLRTLSLTHQVLSSTPLDAVMLIVWVVGLGLPIALITLLAAKRPIPDGPEPSESG